MGVHPQTIVGFSMTNRYWGAIYPPWLYHEVFFKHLVTPGNHRLVCVSKIVGLQQHGFSGENPSSST